MIYNRFEDLPVWNAAQALAADVFELVARPGFAKQGDLRNQLQRSSLSISNNVAEGFERGTTSELLAFLYIARGSAGETRSALRFASLLIERHLLSADCAAPLRALVDRCETISRQLRAWADSLQNTDIRGQRHLNDQTRADYAQRRRAEAFLQKLRALQHPSPPDSTPKEI